MTRLLVSVRNGAEAAAALAGGADVIDVKEPNLGSLGAASVECWREVAAVVKGRAPLSAALGELLTADPRIAAQLPARYQYAKFGLAGCAALADWPQRWAAACRQLPAKVRPVAVAYADQQQAGSPEVMSILEQAASLDCAALLIDTHQKKSGNLLAYWSLEKLQTVAVAARASNLLLVLGGSLTAADLDTVLRCAPDVIAVRGAVCAGDRTAELKSERVAAIVEQLTRSAPASIADPR